MSEAMTASAAATTEDVFEDAVQQDSDEEDNNSNNKDSEDGTGSDTFKVSSEELSILRADLATEFPDDYLYLSDAYMVSVASKPYSKDPTQRRPLEYSLEKLMDVMQWRSEAGAPDMESLVELANNSNNDVTLSTAAVEDPERCTKAKALATALNNASLYWHGFTKTGLPILWIRTNRKPWYPDVDAEVNALILIADAGIRMMPPGITEFAVISESSYPPPPNPTFMIKVLKALVRGYPDRLHVLLSAPVSSIVQFVMNLLLPLMPGRLSSKVVLLGSDAMTESLSDLLLHGGLDIPTFFGGPNKAHDQYYPEESSCPIRNAGGTLKFDYFGMCERLQAAQLEWLEYNNTTISQNNILSSNKGSEDSDDTA